jgi:hypothetical protein
MKHFGCEGRNSEFAKQMGWIFLVFNKVLLFLCLFCLLSEELSPCLEEEALHHKLCPRDGGSALVVLVIQGTSFVGG